MTRQVTGIIHKPDGTPWEAFPIDFTVDPATFTTSATYPVETVTVTTDADGAFAVELETGIGYQVGLRGAYAISGSSTRYPDGTRFAIVVPAGDGPISLEALRAASGVAPTEPSVLDFVEARGVPGGGTTGQALVKASGADYDAAWGDVAGGGGGAAVWGGIGGTLSDQADVQAALDGKADAAALGSAAYTASTAYATAAQGDAADTAVQPGALAAVATSGAYDDLTGTPAIPALPATVVEAVVAGANVTVDSTDPARPVVSASGGGGAATWGTITGTLANQTDLKTALDSKPALAGDGTATTAAKSDHQHAGADLETVVVGGGAQASGTWSTAVGGGSDASGTSATAFGRGAKAASASTTAIGHQSLAQSTNVTAVGSGSRGQAMNATALGRDARAIASRAMALGDSAQSTIADTTVIKANDLDVQRSNGTGSTRHALYSPNGTKYWLAVDDTGALVVTPA